MITVEWEIIKLLLTLIVSALTGGIVSHLKIKSFIIRQGRIHTNSQKGDIHNKTAISQHGDIEQTSITKPFSHWIEHADQVNYYLIPPEKLVSTKNKKGNPSEEFHKIIGEAEQLLRAGKFKESACIYEKASCMEPSEPIPHFYLGFLYLSIGMPDASIIHSEKSIALGKDFFAAWMNLGVAFVHNRQPERAIFAFDRAEQLKDQANAVELGKLYLFRAEARLNFSLQQNHPEQLLHAKSDLDEGEKLLVQEEENPTAKFWLEQVPNRRKSIEGVETT